LPITSLPATEGEGGAAGIGVPYQDYIPFFPMVQDPTTGQWRDGEPDEMLGPEGSEPNAPASPQMLSHLFDSMAPGPTLDPDLFDPNAPGPTLDPRLLLDSDSSGPTIDPALLDASAPRPTIDPALLDPQSQRPTLDPALLKQGLAQPSGFAKPMANATGHGFGDPRLTEEPAQPEPSTPRHDDHGDPLGLG
jgi:hypothetical protein